MRVVDGFIIIVIIVITLVKFIIFAIISQTDDNNMIDAAPRTREGKVVRGAAGPPAHIGSSPRQT